MAYYRLGRYKEAAAALQRNLINTYGDFTTHLDLAATLIELGREEEARAEVTEVLRLEPSFSLEIMRKPWPGKGLERYFTALGKAGLK
jgi:tetratricopeptide (TPR) repeat protein